MAPKMQLLEELRADGKEAQQHLAKLEQQAEHTAKGMKVCVGDSRGSYKCMVVRSTHLWRVGLHRAKGMQACVAS